MSKTFDMIDLGLLHYYLGVEVWQISSSIFVSQTIYAKSLFDKFKMTDCKILSTPMEKGLKLSTKTNSKAVNELVYKQLVGSLIYLTSTRPDLSFAMSQCCTYRHQEFIAKGPKLKLLKIIEKLQKIQK
jgi:hypothetical protein